MTLRLTAAVTVDVALLTIRARELTILLVERDAPPFDGCWALPGGFVEADEDLDAAARRELAEETGVTTDLSHLEQLRTYDTPGRDPRGPVVSVAFLAMGPSWDEPVAASDARAAHFWPVADLPALAFDHATIVADAVERARAKLEYTTLATAFAGEAFTMAELQHVYEAVWGVTLHGPNFRRKVTATEGFVEPVDGRERPTRGRPAALWRSGPAAALHPALLRPEP